MAITRKRLYDIKLSSITLDIISSLINSVEITACQGAIYHIYFFMNRDVKTRLIPNVVLTHQLGLGVCDGEGSCTVSAGSISHVQAHPNRKPQVLQVWNPSLPFPYHICSTLKSPKWGEKQCEKVFNRNDQSHLRLKIQWCFLSTGAKMSDIHTNKHFRPEAIP